MNIKILCRAMLMYRTSSTVRYSGLSIGDLYWPDISEVRSLVSPLILSGSRVRQALYTYQHLKVAGTCCARAGSIPVVPIGG